MGDESSERSLHWFVEMIPVFVIVNVAAILLALIVGQRTLTGIGMYVILVSGLWVAATFVFATLELAGEMRAQG